MMPHEAFGVKVLIWREGLPKGGQAAVAAQQSMVVAEIQIDDWYKKPYQIAHNPPITNNQRS